MAANHLKKFQFKSKQDAMSKAKKSHLCLDCLYRQPQNWKICPQCGGKNRQYFMSEAELKRGLSLLQAQDIGHISELSFQKQFDLVVNEKLIAKYRCDAAYIKNGVQVIEDTKPKRFIDETAKIKMTLFEAIYGIKIHVPQRESGGLE